MLLENSQVKQNGWKAIFCFSLIIWYTASESGIQLYADQKLPAICFLYIGGSLCIFLPSMFPFSLRYFLCNPHFSVYMDEKSWYLSSLCLPLLFLCSITSGHPLKGVPRLLVFTEAASSQPQNPYTY